MNLLDRHIFRSALFTCLAAVGVFAFVLMTGNVLRDLIGPGLSGQLSLVEFVRLTLLLVPFVISYALPMGMLTGVLLTLGRLSADNEVTAMRAAGVSLKRIAAPVLVLGLVGAAAGIPINFRSMPWARVAYDRELDSDIRADPRSLLVPKTFVHDFPGWVIYVSERSGRNLRNLWVWRLDAQKRATSLWHADTGTIDYDKTVYDLILTLNGVQSETVATKNTDPESYTEPPNIMTAEHWDPMHLPLSKVFTHPPGRQKLQWMTYSQLKREEARRSQDPALANAKEKAHAVMQVKLTITDKINTALAVLTFAFVGAPLGIKISRRETSANLVLAVALALGWYVLTISIGWLDRHPEYRPDLLLFLPNLLFFAIGWLLFRRIDHA